MSRSKPEEVMLQRNPVILRRKSPKNIVVRDAATSERRDSLHSSGTQNEAWDRGSAGVLSRRKFLQRAGLGAVATAALGGASCRARAQGKSPQLDEKPQQDEVASGLKGRVLGRTKLKVTELSYGGGPCRDPAVLDAAIDSGINLVHTSPGYADGKSIKAFGEVMKRRRSEVILAVKVAPGGVDAALKALNTDHIDIIVPPAHDVATIENPHWPEQFAALKQAGKIRFSGFATHNHQAEVIRRAVQLGYFDVMLVAYNIANKANLDSVIQQARRTANMGFMVMKSTRGAGNNWSAAWTSILRTPGVATILKGAGSIEELRKYRAFFDGEPAVGWQDTAERLARACIGETCAMCGACSVCPQHVAVADIFRYQMYYVDYGETRKALDGYARLDSQRRADNCTDCGACEQLCTNKLPIRAKLRRAHALLA